MISTSDDFWQENSIRAMQNEYIVEHLFSYLSVDDIKNCRLVNRNWRNIGTKILRRRAHVLFTFSTGYRTFRPPPQEAIFLEKIKRMKEISDYCKENIPEMTPISSFSFEGEFEKFHLTKFLDDVRGYMKELKITSEIYQLGQKITTVDLSPKMPSHLTTLHIRMCNLTKTKLSLCFDQLSCVKDIDLDNCTIILNGNGKRLSPSRLTLGSGNKYIKNGRNVKFLVNKSFNVTLTKQINLDGKNLIVDFTDCANNQVVERTVRLWNVTVRNWEMCNWKMKKLNLLGVPFLDKNFIEMEDLLTFDSSIDLSKIYNPTSLLTLYCHNMIFVEAPFFLPNVVDVTLGCESCVAKLPYFTNNKNISKMCLRSRGDDPISVNINDLPKGITELSLTEVRVHGEGVYQLPTLNMETTSASFHFSKCATVGAKFRPEIFRISDFCIGVDDDEDMQLVFELLNMGDSYGRLVIGYFDWVGTVFNNSVFSNYVDREARCYVFEGKRGKGLTEEEAEKEFAYMCT